MLSPHGFVAPCNKITECLDRLTELTAQTARLSAIVRHSLLLIAIVLIFLIFLELQFTCRKQHREIVPFFERSSEETSNSGRNCEKTVNHSIRWGRAILCSVTIMSHSPCRPGQTSRTRGRATSSLNSSSYSVLRGLQRNVLHGPSNTFQSPISKLSHLHMWP